MKHLKRCYPVLLVVTHVETVKTTHPSSVETNLSDPTHSSAVRRSTLYNNVYKVCKRPGLSHGPQKLTVAETNKIDAVLLRGCLDDLFRLVSFQVVHVEVKHQDLSFAAARYFTNFVVEEIPFTQYLYSVRQHTITWRFLENGMTVHLRCANLNDPNRSLT